MRKLNFILIVALLVFALAIPFSAPLNCYALEEYEQVDKKYFVTKENMETVLNGMGVDRTAFTQGEKAAADYIAGKFSDYKLGMLNGSYLHSFGTGGINESKSYNVVGRLLGKNSDKHIVIGAHYDNAYKLGKKTTSSSGVYDNLSGVMCVLKLAQALSEYQKTNELACDIVFVCYGAEEVGMLGSKEFVKYCRLNNHNNIFAFNFDSIGCGEELYYYSGEVMTTYDSVIKGAVEGLTLPFEFSKLPFNKKLNFFGGYENSVYSNIGLQSDIISYLNGNVSSTTFFSGNWSQSSQFVESSRFEDNIHHTENDNIEVLFERFPDCLDKINSVISVAYASVVSGQIAEIDSSMFNGFVFNNKIIIVAIGLFTMMVIIAAGRNVSKKKFRNT